MSASNKYRFFILAALFTMFATFVVYLPSLQNDSVSNWDDDLYVFENPNIKSIDLDFLRWSLTAVVVALWHPLTLFSFALDYAVWGLNPLGYHLTNVLIHTLNTFLIFSLAIQLIKHLGLRKALHIKTLMTGAITALLFGIHPLHVESVAWISERKDVLCAFFFLLSILAYLKYTIASDSKKKVFYAASFISFAFAILSKPMAVSLPLILLILDYYPLNRLRLGVKAQLVEKLPFILLSALISLITVWASEAGGALRSLESYSLMIRLIIAVRAYIFYLLKMLFPFELAPFYPYPSKMEYLTLEHMVFIVILSALTFLCIRLAKRNKLFLAAWLYYLLTLIPVIGVFQAGSQAMADRYTYLPSIGPFLLAGLYVGTIFERSIKMHQITIIAVLLIISGSLVNMTIRQIAIWDGPLRLWTHAIKLFPHVAIAYNNRGLAYYNLKNYQAAIKELNKAVDIDPRFADAYNNLGLVYSDLGNFQKEIKNYDKAAKLYPQHRDVYLNRGTAYIKIGNYLQAINDYTKAIEINSQDVAAYYMRGLAHYNSGNYKQALNDMNMVIKINPGDTEARYVLNILYSKRDPKETASQLQPSAGRVGVSR